MTLSVLQRRHGLDPSHLVFFIRHRSQAFRTRLRMPSTLSCVEAGFGESDRRLDVGEMGDMVIDYVERLYQDQNLRRIAKRRWGLFMFLRQLKRDDQPLVSGCA
jgi:hypothetical protein